MELVYDDKTGTWGEAPEVYGTIECATKEDYEYAKKAIKGYKELEAKHWDECRQIAHYDDEIKRLEAADVQPVKHGRWISLDYDTYFECSVCKNVEDIESNFCPRCGADMRGDTD